MKGSVVLELPCEFDAVEPLDEIVIFCRMHLCLVIGSWGCFPSYLFSFRTPLCDKHRGAVAMKTLFTEISTEFQVLDLAEHLRLGSDASNGVPIS